jgi:protein-S-isoprenylcysteine O-methyltransferase Ste14
MRIRERWIGLLYRAATGTREQRTLLTPIGVLVFAAFTALFVLAAVLVDRWLDLPWPVPAALTRLLAVVLLSTGIAATAWSGAHFLRVKGTPVPFNPPPEPVTTGPYRFARNPMLTGVFLFLFGIGFAIGSLSLVVVFTPLFILANIWELKHIEEPELVRRLGDDYVAYRQHTPMFIPRLKREP